MRSLLCVRIIVRLESRALADTSLLASERSEAKKRRENPDDAALLRDAVPTDLGLDGTASCALVNSNSGGTGPSTIGGASSPKNRATFSIQAGAILLLVVRS